jgi:hypothetical protein
VCDFVLDFDRLTVLSLSLAGKRVWFIIVDLSVVVLLSVVSSDWLAIIDYLHSLSILDIVWSEFDFASVLQLFLSFVLPGHSGLFHNAELSILDEANTPHTQI